MVNHSKNGLINLIYTSHLINNDIKCHLPSKHMANVMKKINIYSGCKPGTFNRAIKQAKAIFTTHQL